MVSACLAVLMRHAAATRCVGHDSASHVYHCCVNPLSGDSIVYILPPQVVCKAPALQLPERYFLMFFRGPNGVG